MIPFEIEYLQPDSLDSALAAYDQLESAGKSVRYLSGGTELITMARDGKLHYDALIDLKRVPELTAVDVGAGMFGACLRLNEVETIVPDRGIGTLLRQAVAGIADHTTRNSITLGGNMCGMLPYREAILPFLSCGGTIDVAGPNGARQLDLSSFENRLRLEPGEFVVSVRFDPGWYDAAVFYRRRTRDARIDYPVLTMCMAALGADAGLAVSGVFAGPTRSAEVDGIIGSYLAKGGTPSAIAREAGEAFGQRFREDIRAGAEYREAMLRMSIEDGLKSIGGKR